MAEEKINNAWPLPKFCFKVSIDELGELTFEEMFEVEVELSTEKQDGSNMQFSESKISAIKKRTTLHLKKGTFVSNNKLLDWFDTIRLNINQRESMTISLLDQEGNPTMVWKVANARPIKVTGVNLKSDGNEATIEQLDLSHEGVTIENVVANMI